MKAGESANNGARGGQAKNMHGAQCICRGSSVWEWPRVSATVQGAASRSWLRPNRASLLSGTSVW